MRFPEPRARLLPETAWQTDTVGMSRSTVLLFEDRVLKIDQDWEESRREAPLRLSEKPSAGVFAEQVPRPLTLPAPPYAASVP